MSDAEEDSVKKAKYAGEVGVDGSPIGEDNVEQLAPPFVHQYHVVKRILEHLNLGDVFKAAVVNRQWAEVARNVRKQRKSYPYAILLHPYVPHHRLAFEYFNEMAMGEDVSEEATELVTSGNNGYYAYGPRSPSRQKFNGFIAEVKKEFRKKVEQAYDEPQLIICFATESFEKLLERHISTNRLSKKDRMNILMNGVHSSIPCIASFSCGVIASVPESQKSLELEETKLPCLSGLAIPKVAGLTFKIFTITKKVAKGLKDKKENAESFREILGIEDETDLKGIIFFQRASAYSGSLIGTLYEYLKANPHLALAGGVHHSISINGFEENDIAAGGLLIYGKENVQVSTTALCDADMSDSNKEKLELLQLTLIPGGASFAFMFACNGRGRGMHQIPNLESDLFHSLFPKTPMLGAFTYGEYCFTPRSPPNASDEESEEASFPANIDFSYTTVFMLVSFKHPEEPKEA